MARRDIYLDVDGVLLRNAPSTVAGIEPAPHCFAFLKWAVRYHRPHWLTTRDSHGRHDGIVRAFRLAMGCAELPGEIDALIRSVKPTAWSGHNKTSGIDLTSDFVWIDDEPLEYEVDALISLNVLERLIVVDSNKDDGALLRAIERVNHSRDRHRAWRLSRFPRSS